MKKEISHKELCEAIRRVTHVLGLRDSEAGYWIRPLIGVWPTYVPYTDNYMISEQGYRVLQAILGPNGHTIIKMYAARRKTPDNENTQCRS